LVVIHLFQK